MLRVFVRLGADIRAGAKPHVCCRDYRRAFKDAGKVLMGSFWRLAIRASQNDVSFMQNASKRPYVTAKNNHSIRPTAS